MGKEIFDWSEQIYGEGDQIYLEVVVVIDDGVVFGEVRPHIRLLKLCGYVQKVFVPPHLS